MTNCKACNGTDVQTLMVGRDQKCRCKACGLTWWNLATPKYEVTYYDYSSSTHGVSVKTRQFFADQYAEAKKFAAGHVLYAKPCKVVEI